MKVNTTTVSFLLSLFLLLATPISATVYSSVYSIYSDSACSGDSGLSGLTWNCSAGTPESCIWQCEDSGNCAGFTYVEQDTRATCRMDSTVTCYFATEDELTGLWYDGVDVLAQVTPANALADPTTIKHVSFLEVKGATLGIRAKKANATAGPSSCTMAGLLFKCTSSDVGSKWHNLISSNVSALAYGLFTEIAQPPLSNGFSWTSRYYSRSSFNMLCESTSSYVPAPVWDPSARKIWGSDRFSHFIIAPGPTFSLYNPPETLRNYSSGTVKQSMLDGTEAWLAATPYANEYVSLDLGAELLVSGVVTQGRASGIAAQYVTGYTVQVALADKVFGWVDGGQVFSANADRSSKVTNTFRAGAVVARYIRVIPSSWVAAIAMRMAVYRMSAMFSNCYFYSNISLTGHTGQTCYFRESASPSPTSSPTASPSLSSSVSVSPSPSTSLSTTTTPTPSSSISDTPTSSISLSASPSPSPSPSPTSSTSLSASPSLSLSPSPSSSSSSSTFISPSPTPSPSSSPSFFPSVSSSPSLSPSSSPSTTPSPSPSPSPSQAALTSPSPMPSDSPSPGIQVLSEGGVLNNFNIDEPLVLYTTAGQQGDNWTFSWRLNYPTDDPVLTAAVENVTTATLRVAPGLLVPGKAYVLQLTACDVRNACTTVDVHLNTNMPPVNGTCGVTPAAGRAYETVFTFRCVDWTDLSSDFPLTYRFDLKPTRADREDVTLRSFKSLEEVALRLPGGDREITALVRDRNGAISRFPMRVPVENIVFTEQGAAESFAEQLSQELVSAARASGSMDDMAQAVILPTDLLSFTSEANVTSLTDLVLRRQDIREFLYQNLMDFANNASSGATASTLLRNMELLNEIAGIPLELGVSFRNDLLKDMMADARSVLARASELTASEATWPKRTLQTLSSVEHSMQLSVLQNAEGQIENDAVVRLETEASEYSMEYTNHIQTISSGMVAAALPGSASSLQSGPFSLFAARESSSTFNSGTGRPIQSSSGGGGAVVLPAGVLANAGMQVPVVDLHVSSAPNAFARTIHLRHLLRRRQLQFRHQLLESPAETPPLGTDSVLVVSFTDPNGTMLNVANVGSLGGNHEGSSGVLGSTLEHPEGAIELVMKHDTVPSLSTERICRFWDENAQAWSTEGCVFVACKSNESVTVCACQHLTAFNINFADFIPAMNLLVPSDLTNLTPSNLQRFPKGMIGLGVAYAILLFFLPFSLRRDMREKDINQRKEWIRHLQARLKKDLTVKTLAKESWRAHHRVSSMFFRPFGDNYTSFQRWCVISTELFIMITISAFFFGSSNQADYTIIIISEIIAIIFGFFTEEVLMRCGELSFSEKIEYQAKLLLESRKPQNERKQVKKPTRFPWYVEYLVYLLCLAIACVCSWLILVYTMKFNLETVDNVEWQSKAQEMVAGAVLFESDIAAECQNACLTDQRCDGVTFQRLTNRCFVVDGDIALSPLCPPYQAVVVLGGPHGPTIQYSDRLPVFISELPLKGLRAIELGDAWLNAEGIQFAVDFFLIQPLFVLVVFAKNWLLRNKKQVTRGHLASVLDEPDMQKVFAEIIGEKGDATNLRDSSGLQSSSSSGSNVQVEAEMLKQPSGEIQNDTGEIQNDTLDKLHSTLGIVLAEKKNTSQSHNGRTRQERESLVLDEGDVVGFQTDVSGTPPPQHRDSLLASSHDQLSGSNRGVMGNRTRTSSLVLPQHSWSSHMDPRRHSLILDNPLARLSSGTPGPTGPRKMTLGSSRKVSPMSINRTLPTQPEENEPLKTGNLPSDASPHAEAPRHAR
eukprot:g64163.t1